MDKYGLLLTAALAAAPSTIQIGYDIEGISKHLHYLHIMCYDYHGSWDAQTGHNAPLRLPNGTSLIPELRLSVVYNYCQYFQLNSKFSWNNNNILLKFPFLTFSFSKIVNENVLKFHSIYIVNYFSQY